MQIPKEEELSRASAKGQDNVIAKYEANSFRLFHVFQQERLPLICQRRKVHCKAPAFFAVGCKHLIPGLTGMQMEHEREKRERTDIIIIVFFFWRGNYTCREQKRKEGIRSPRLFLHHLKDLEELGWDTGPLLLFADVSLSFPFFRFLRESHEWLSPVVSR